MPTTRATRSTPTRLHARRADPVLDWSKLTRDQAAALIEVTVEDFLDGRGEDAREVRRVHFKLANKIDALELLGKHHRLTWNGTCMTSATASPSAWRPRWRGWTAAHGAPGGVRPDHRPSRSGAARRALRKGKRAQA